MPIRRIAPPWPTSTSIARTRSGVDGKLVVTADAFELTARLGLLVGVFRQRIESEIEENLDSLLSKSTKAPAKAAKSAAKKK